MDDFDFDVLTGPSGPDCRACRPVKPPASEHVPAEPETKEMAVPAKSPSALRG